MSVYHRLRRLLGADTTIQRSKEMPVFEYRVIHTNGDVSTLLAHGYNIDGAFARFYMYTDVYTYSIMNWSVGASGQENVRVLDSIKEIKNEKVGETTLSATIDRADGTILNTDVTTETVSSHTL